MEVRGCGVDRGGGGGRRTDIPHTVAKWPFHSDVHTSQSFLVMTSWVSEADGAEDLPPLGLQDPPCFHSQGLYRDQAWGSRCTTEHPFPSPLLPPGHPVLCILPAPP